MTQATNRRETLALRRSNRNRITAKPKVKPMSDMRETLIEIIGTQVEFCGAADAADAIIAALPNMVKPLEWEDWSSGHRLNYASVKNGYGVMQMYFPETHFRVTLRGETIGTASTEEAARTAAQSHFTAESVSAFWVQGGEA
ncbi:MAG: hypothetical protein V7786_01740 [Sulfitobacter litoralis]|uniref:hypothetical protein n=1 Tax=Sulfitobacter litoralis TaxID=335975 RepID=UPI003002FE21